MGRLSFLSGTNASLRGDGRLLALIAITGGSFMTIGVQMIYPVLLADLRIDYGLDLSMAGLLLSVLWVINAFGQLPGGLLADRFGEKNTLLGSAILTVITIGFLIIGQSLTALFVATAVLGLAIGLFGVARYTAILRLYPDRAGASIGVMVAGADAGQALLPAIAGILATAVAWQFGFGFTIPLFIVLIVAIWLWVPGRSSEQTWDDASVSREAVQLLANSMRSRSVGLSSLAFFLYVSIWITFSSFYPTYLVEVKAMPPQRAGLLFGLFFAMGIGMKPLAGSVYDRYGIRVSLLLIAGVSGIAWLLLPFLTGIWVLVVATVFMAPVLGAGAITQTHMLNDLPDDVHGSVLGIVRTVAMTIGGLLPTVVGTMAERGFFNEVFFGLAAVAGLLVVLAFMIPVDRIEPAAKPT